MQFLLCIFQRIFKQLPSPKGSDWNLGIGGPSFTYLKTSGLDCQPKYFETKPREVFIFEGRSYTYITWGNSPIDTTLIRMVTVKYSQAAAFGSQLGLL